MRRLAIALALALLFSSPGMAAASSASTGSAKSSVKSSVKSSAASSKAGIKTTIVVDPASSAAASTALVPVEEEEDGEELVFSDVDDTQWYAPYVYAIVRWGLASGYRNGSGALIGTFGPADPVTVAQLLKMSLEASGRSMGVCGKQAAQLAQAAGHWAEMYVACGEEIGMRIFNRQVDLDRPVQRGEALGMIHDALQVIVPEVQSPFADTAAHLYKNDIAFDAARKIVSGDTNAVGYPTGNFRPNDPLTRGEIAKILYLTKLTDQDVSDTPQTLAIDLTVTNFAFSPATIVVPKDAIVTLRIHNTGHHAFVVPELGIHVPLEEAETTIAFTAREAGTFAFHCDVPGHEGAGMVGTIMVK